MLFWNNDYSPGLADHMRPVRSAVRPASAECRDLSFIRWMECVKHRAAPFTENIPVFRWEYTEMRTISHCYISFVRLRSRILPCSFGGTPRCVDVLKSRVRHKVACRACVRILMYSGNLVNTGHRCDSQKYPSSDVNTIDRNIDYRSKCSSMIYGKTNVQSIAMKEDRSSAMVSLNTLQTTISLNIYKTAQINLVEKRVSKLKMKLKIITNQSQNWQGC